MTEHQCKESYGKIPFIKVNSDNTYTCEDCNKKITIEEIFGNEN